MENHISKSQKWLLGLVSILGDLCPFSLLRLGWAIESISSELTLLWGFPGDSVVKNPPAMQETQV